MRKLTKLLTLLLVLAFAVPASAEKLTRRCRLRPLLTAVSLNAGAASRTFTVGPKECNAEVSGYAMLTLEVAHTWAKDGNIVLTCLVGSTIATATFTPQACAGSGTCTAVDGGIFSKGVTADKSYSVRLGHRGYAAISCVASHDNTPGAGDVVTVTGYLTD